MIAHIRPTTLAVETAVSTGYQEACLAGQKHIIPLRSKTDQDK